MKLVVVAAACAAGWASVYGIVLALVHYPRETVAVAVFLVACWVVFVDWRNELALTERGHDDSSDPSVPQGIGSSRKAPGSSAPRSLNASQVPPERARL